LTTSPTVLPSETLAPTDTSQPIPSSTSTSQPTVSSASSVEVDFIDVGQGDGILIQSSDGTNVVIDGGEQGSGELPYLQSKNIKRVDMMVATHPHSDHIGGLVDVLNAIPVSKVVTNGQPHTTGVYEKFLDGIANAKAEYIEAKRGDTLQAGNLTLQVLSPVSAASGDFNNNSLVLRLVVGKVTFLFTGDAQMDAEASLIAANLPLKADILKVGHHGSHTSSSMSFLSQVKPAVAVYMAGVDNQYGHPHSETIASLNSIGAKIYGTDVNGTVSVTTDGNTYQITTLKSAPIAQQDVATPAPVVASSGSMGQVAITSVTSPVKTGATAMLNATTSAGASCTITVNYKSGPSKASGLGPKVADASGNISWSWKVGASTTPGTWRIVVKCSQGGTDMTQETTFTVTK
jgi:competence protein ComEC